jgi:hypothetical protein
VSEFETTAPGCRLATSVGGVLTGRGADIIIIDDPLKPEEALSRAQRQAANDWFDHTLYSRLNDNRTGAIILIMHRLHESLPSGLTRGTISRATCWRSPLGARVRAPVGWCIGDAPREVVRLRAVADGDELRRVETPFGWQSFGRKAGEPCTPSASHWRPLSRSAASPGLSRGSANIISPANTSRPRPQGGGMVKAAWFRSYAPNERPDKFDRVVQSWDTANKASELSPRPNPPPHAGEGRVGGARAGGSRARTSTYYTCCASAWNTPS